MLLYHYCSNSTFLSIVQNRQLWATELSLSNDLLEGRWVREVLKELWGENEKTKAHTLHLVEMIDFVIDMVGAAGVCLSTESDSLSQWRGYADDGAGVSIGFDSDFLETLSPPNDEPFGTVLTKVTYNVEEQKRQIEPFLDEVIRGIENGGLKARLPRSYATELLFPLSQQEKASIQSAYLDLSFRFFAQFSILYSMKNPAFGEEKEWRLLSYLMKPGGIYLDSNPPTLEFIAKRNCIAPMRKIPISGPHAIKRVVLGPRNITPKNIVNSVCSRYGFQDVEVATSSASYR